MSAGPQTPGSARSARGPVVYLAALASTLLPALRPSRIYPADALRYE